MSKKIRDRPLLCNPKEDGNGPAGNPGNTAKFEKRKRCCLFDDLASTKDSFFLWLQDGGTFDGSEERIEKICRCTRCGAYVQYIHEEIRCYYPECNWDDMDIYDRFTPVYEGREEDGTITYEQAGREVTFLNHYYDRN